MFQKTEQTPPLRHPALTFKRDTGGSLQHEAHGQWRSRTGCKDLVRSTFAELYLAFPIRSTHSSVAVRSGSDEVKN